MAFMKERKKACQIGGRVPEPLRERLLAASKRHGVAYIEIVEHALYVYLDALDFAAARSRGEEARL